MSHVKLENDQYRLVFGVDRAIGCFFQIYEKLVYECSAVAVPTSTDKDEDRPHVTGSEMYGLRINHAATLGRNISLARLLKDYEPLDLLKRALRTEDWIVALASTLGFSNISQTECMRR